LSPDVGFDILLGDADSALDRLSTKKKVEVRQQEPIFDLPIKQDQWQIFFSRSLRFSCFETLEKRS